MSEQSIIPPEELDTHFQSYFDPKGEDWQRDFGSKSEDERAIVAYQSLAEMDKVAEANPEYKDTMGRGKGLLLSAYARSQLRDELTYEQEDVDRVADKMKPEEWEQFAAADSENQRAVLDTIYMLDSQEKYAKWAEKNGVQIADDAQIGEFVNSEANVTPRAATLAWYRAKADRDITMAGWAMTEAKDKIELGKGLATQQSSLPSYAEGQVGTGGAPKEFDINIGVEEVPLDGKSKRLRISLPGQEGAVAKVIEKDIPIKSYEQAQTDLRTRHKIVQDRISDLINRMRYSSQASPEDFNAAIGYLAQTGKVGENKTRDTVYAMLANGFADIPANPEVKQDELLKSGLDVANKEQAALAAERKRTADIGKNIIPMSQQIAKRQALGKQLEQQAMDYEKSLAELGELSGSMHLGPIADYEYAKGDAIREAVKENRELIPETASGELDFFISRLGTALTTQPAQMFAEGMKAATSDEMIKEYGVMQNLVPDLGANAILADFSTSLADANKKFGKFSINPREAALEATGTSVSSLPLDKSTVARTALPEVASVLGMAGAGKGMAKALGGLTETGRELTRAEIMLTAGKYLRPSVVKAVAGKVASEQRLAGLLTSIATSSRAGLDVVNQAREAGVDDNSAIMMGFESTLANMGLEYPMNMFHLRGVVRGADDIYKAAAKTGIEEGGERALKASWSIRAKVQDVVRGFASTQLHGLTESATEAMQFGMDQMILRQAVRGQPEFDGWREEAAAGYVMGMLMRTGAAYNGFKEIYSDNVRNAATAIAAAAKAQTDVVKMAAIAINPEIQQPAAEETAANLSKKDIQTIEVDPGEVAPGDTVEYGMDMDQEMVRFGVVKEVKDGKVTLTMDLGDGSTVDATVNKQDITSAYRQTYQMPSQDPMATPEVAATLEQKKAEAAEAEKDLRDAKTATDAVTTLARETGWAAGTFAVDFSTGSRSRADLDGGGVTISIADMVATMKAKRAAGEAMTEADVKKLAELTVDEEFRHLAYEGAVEAVTERYTPGKTKAESKAAVDGFMDSMFQGAQKQTAAAVAQGGQVYGQEAWDGMDSAGKFRELARMASQQISFGQQTEQVAKFFGKSFEELYGAATASESNVLREEALRAGEAFKTLTGNLGASGIDPDWIDEFDAKMSEMSNAFDRAADNAAQFVEQEQAPAAQQAPLPDNDATQGGRTANASSTGLTPDLMDLLKYDRVPEGLPAHMTLTTLFGSDSAKREAMLKDFVQVRDHAVQQVINMGVTPGNVMRQASLAALQRLGVPVDVSTLPDTITPQERIVMEAIGGDIENAADWDNADRDMDAPGGERHGAQRRTNVPDKKPVEVKVRSKPVSSINTRLFFPLETANPKAFASYGKEKLAKAFEVKANYIQAMRLKAAIDQGIVPVVVSKDGKETKLTKAQAKSLISKAEDEMRVGFGGVAKNMSVVIDMNPKATELRMESATKTMENPKGKKPITYETDTLVVPIRMIRSMENRAMLVEDFGGVANRRAVKGKVEAMRVTHKLVKPDSKSRAKAEAGDYDTNAVSRYIDYRPLNTEKGLIDYGKAADLIARAYMVQRWAAEGHFRRLKGKVSIADAMSYYLGAFGPEAKPDASQKRAIRPDGTPLYGDKAQTVLPNNYFNLDMSQVDDLSLTLTHYKEQIESAIPGEKFPPVRPPKTRKIYGIRQAHITPAMANTTIAPGVGFLEQTFDMGTPVKGNSRPTPPTITMFSDAEFMEGLDQAENPSDMIWRNKEQGLPFKEQFKEGSPVAKFIDLAANMRRQRKDGELEQMRLASEDVADGDFTWDAVSEIKSAQEKDSDEFQTTRMSSDVAGNWNMQAIEGPETVRGSFKRTLLAIEMQARYPGTFSHLDHPDALVSLAENPKTESADYSFATPKGKAIADAEQRISDLKARDSDLFKEFQAVDKRAEGIPGKGKSSDAMRAAQIDGLKKEREKNKSDLAEAQAELEEAKAMEGPETDTGTIPGNKNYRPRTGMGRMAATAKKQSFVPGSTRIKKVVADLPGYEQLQNLIWGKYYSAGAVSFADAVRLSAMVEQHRQSLGQYLTQGQIQDLILRPDAQTLKTAGRAAAPFLQRRADGSEKLTKAWRNIVEALLRPNADEGETIKNFLGMSDSEIAASDPKRARLAADIGTFRDFAYRIAADNAIIPERQSVEYWKGRWDGIPIADLLLGLESDQTEKDGQMAFSEDFAAVAIKAHRMLSQMMPQDWALPQLRKLESFEEFYVDTGVAKEFRDADGVQMAETVMRTIFDFDPASHAMMRWIAPVFTGYRFFAQSAEEVLSYGLPSGVHNLTDKRGSDVPIIYHRIYQPSGLVVANPESGQRTHDRITLSESLNSALPQKTTEMQRVRDAAMQYAEFDPMEPVRRRVKPHPKNPGDPAATRSNMRFEMATNLAGEVVGMEEVSNQRLAGSLSKIVDAGKAYEYQNWRDPAETAREGFIREMMASVPLGWKVFNTPGDFIAEMVINPRFRKALDAMAPWSPVESSDNLAGMQAVLAQTHVMYVHNPGDPMPLGGLESALYDAGLMLQKSWTKPMTLKEVVAEIAQAKEERASELKEEAAAQAELEAIEKMRETHVSADLLREYLKNLEFLDTTEFGMETFYAQGAFTYDYLPFSAPDGQPSGIKMVPIAQLKRWLQPILGFEQTSQVIFNVYNKTRRFFRYMAERAESETHDSWTDQVMGQPSPARTDFDSIQKGQYAETQQWADPDDLVDEADVSGFASTYNDIHFRQSVAEAKGGRFAFASAAGATANVFGTMLRWTTSIPVLPMSLAARAMAGSGNMKAKTFVAGSIKRELAQNNNRMWQQFASSYATDLFYVQPRNGDPTIADQLTEVDGFLRQWEQPGQPYAPNGGAEEHAKFVRGAINEALRVRQLIDNGAPVPHSTRSIQALIYAIRADRMEKTFGNTARWYLRHVMPAGVARDLMPRLAGQLSDRTWGQEQKDGNRVGDFVSEADFMSHLAESQESRDGLDRAIAPFHQGLDQLGMRGRDTNGIFAEYEQRLAPFQKKGTKEANTKAYIVAQLLSYAKDPAGPMTEKQIRKALLLAGKRVKGVMFEQFNQPDAKAYKKLYKDFGISDGKNESRAYREMWNDSLNPIFNDFADGKLTVAQYKDALEDTLTPMAKLWKDEVNKIFQEIHPKLKSATLLARAEQLGEWESYMPLITVILKGNQPSTREGLLDPGRRSPGLERNQTMDALDDMTDSVHAGRMGVVMRGEDAVRLGLERAILMIHGAVPAIVTQSLLGKPTDDNKGWEDGLIVSEYRRWMAIKGPSGDGKGNRDYSVEDAMKNSQLRILGLGMESIARALSDAKKAEIQSRVMPEGYAAMLRTVGAVGYGMALADLSQFYRQTLPGFVAYAGGGKGNAEAIGNVLFRYMTDSSFRENARAFMLKNNAWIALRGDAQLEQIMDQRGGRENADARSLPLWIWRVTEKVGAALPKVAQMKLRLAVGRTDGFLARLIWLARAFQTVLKPEEVGDSAKQDALMLGDKMSPAMNMGILDSVDTYIGTTDRSRRIRFQRPTASAAAAFFQIVVGLWSSHSLSLRSRAGAAIAKMSSIDADYRAQGFADFRAILTQQLAFHALNKSIIGGSGLMAAKAISPALATALEWALGWEERDKPEWDIKKDGNIYHKYLGLMAGDVSMMLPASGRISSFLGAMIASAQTQEAYKELLYTMGIIPPPYRPKNYFPDNPSMQIFQGLAKLGVFGPADPAIDFTTKALAGTIDNSSGRSMKQDDWMKLGIATTLAFFGTRSLASQAYEKFSEDRRARRAPAPNRPMRRFGEPFLKKKPKSYY